MGPIRIRSSVGLLSVLLFSAAVSLAGCGDGGGDGKGGQHGDASAGAGGGGKGGSGGSGGVTTLKDGGNDVPVATGGAGGIDGGTGGSTIDATIDVPTGTGGVGGIDGGPGVDGAKPVDGAVDGGSIDGAVAASLHLYVGCADTTGTVQVYALDHTTGAVSSLSNFAAGGAVSNAEFNDSEDRFYLAHLQSNVAQLSTFSRNTTTGGLTIMGTPVPVPYSPPGTGGGVDGGGVDGAAPSTNAGPQTLTFDRSRHFVAVPNYFSGYVYVYSVGSDGGIGSLVSWHTAGSNAHHAVFTLNNDFVMVPYLGSNLIQVYAFNDTTGALTPTVSTTLPSAKSGPRHLALHSNGNWLYSINETAGESTTTTGSIDLFLVDQTAGMVTSKATYTVPLPTGYTGAKNGSEIEIAPSGNLLFVSMRLDNAATGSLVAYRIDATTGALTLIEQESSHGITPRHFSLTKDGRMLVVGNQNSNTIAVFQVDPTTGDMTFLRDQAVCTSPRFARMAPVK
jgi:6-phosphogluconolactonase (cycloisomerase 2 family)